MAFLKLRNSVATHQVWNRKLNKEKDSAEEMKV